MNLIYRLGLMGFLLFGLGCSRGVNKNAAVSLQLPGGVGSQKVGSLDTPANHKLTRVEIRISGSGASGSFTWDACEKENSDGDCVTPAVTEAKFEGLPSGVPVLIQYLAAYDHTDESIGTMVVKYGNYAGNLAPGLQTVPITAKVYGSETGNKEARISGQYVTAKNAANLPAGPTGALRIAFDPGGGKPLIVVQETEMFNGYFNFFGIDGVPMAYQFVADGKRPIELTVPKIKERIAANSPTVMKLSMPKAFIDRACLDPDCGDDIPARDYFLGYYGPGLSLFSDLAACYEGSNYSTVTSGTTALKVNYGGSFIGWNGDGTDSTAFRWVGGGQTVDGPCASLNDFEKRLKVDFGMIDYGFHNVAAFTGPFQHYYHSFSKTECNRTGDAVGCFDEAPNTITIKAKLLQGVFGSSGDKVRGVDIFAKDVSSSYCNGGDCYRDLQDHMNDGYDCNAMLSKGFVRKGTVANSNVSFAYNKVLAPGRVEMAFVCPFKFSSTNDKIYFKSAAPVHGIYGPPPVVTPNTISGLQLWLDAADPATITSSASCSGSAPTDGGAVGCWKDKSGNNRDAPSLGAPTYNVSGSLMFSSGSNQSLKGQFLAAGGYSGPITVMIVTQNLTDAGFQKYFQLNTQTSPGPHNRFYFGSDSTYNTIVNHFSDGTNTRQLRSNVGGIDTIDPSLTTISYSGTGAASNILRGGSDGGSTDNGGSATSLNIPGTTDFYIGGGDDGQYLNGYVFEVVVFNRVLSAAENTDLSCYLKNKWSIPGGGCP